MKILATMLALMLLFNRCQFIPCPWKSDLVPTFPKEDDIMGSYIPDKRTLNQFDGFSETSKIVFYDGNKISLEDLPHTIFNNLAFTNFSYNKTNGSGVWKQDDSGGLFVSLDLPEQNYEGEYDFSTSWRLYEREGELVIAMIIGDPDECNAMTFIKERTSR